MAALQVAAQAGYSALVKQYRAILDPSLKGVPPPELSATPPINKAEEQQGLDQAASSETWAAQITEDDEDLEADLQRSRIHSPSQQDLQEAADLSGMSIKDRSDQTHRPSWDWERLSCAQIPCHWNCYPVGLLVLWLDRESRGYEGRTPRSPM